MADPKAPLNSSLIRNYVKASQQIEMQMEIDRQGKITGIQKKRKLDDKKMEESKKRGGGGAETIKDLDQHRITWKQLGHRLEIDEERVLKEGLTSQEAKDRNLKQGDNVLTEKVSTPWWVKLLKEWTAPFALVLWAGALLCFIAYAFSPSDPSNMYLGIVLAFVVILTGLITFFQNSKSESVMEGFKNFIPPKCRVIRDGKEDMINATKLVTGDIVVMVEGARVPADVRIIESKEMRVDNSSLTGESEPLLRSPECTDPEKILETKNIAFFGTMCKEGRGKGMVFNIGDHTIIGQIASMAENATSDDTPLRKEIKRFVLMITIISLVLGVIFFGLGFVMKYTVLTNVVFAIGIIVANVPEGLLCTITITLSLAAARMHEKKVLVKTLESVETLGSCSCVCSDKTGTLTQNKMTIENIFYDGQILKAHNKEKMGPKFSYEYDVNSNSFKALQECAIINSEAKFSEALPDKYISKIDALNKSAANYQSERKKIEEDWIKTYNAMSVLDKPTIGDASETGIIKFFQPIEDILEVRKRFPVGSQKDGATAQVPFNSAHKFALKVVKYNTPSSDWCLFLKGAPERVWDKCSHILIKDKHVPFTKDYKALVEKANVSFAKGGQRILGFAKYHLPRSTYPADYKFQFNGAFDLDVPMDSLVFIGLMSLIDPPRDSVPDAVKKCKTAGIKVIMVTGDQQLTAAAIAKQIGIFEEETSVELQERLGCSYDEAVDKARAIVVNGEMLTRAYQEDEGLPENKKGKKLEKWLMKPQIVFARTSPAQKLYIVKGCQSLGYTVAVTGDGVNDSPAINQGDIGIAMGITGSDVAKDSADMVLLNDDFSSIILGIEVGRQIFDNLKKSIAYTMASNIPELVPFLALIFVQIPLPLSTVLMLCVCLGTDMVPAVSFSYEEPELDIMTRKPREKEEHMVTAKLMFFCYGQIGLIESYCGFIVYVIVMYDFGFNTYELFGNAILNYYPHNEGDIYDPNHPFFGNTNLFIDPTYSDQTKQTGNLRLKNTSVNGIQNYDDSNLGRQLDWLYSLHLTQDVRMGFVDLPRDSAGNYVKPAAGQPQIVSKTVYSPCRVYQVSSISMKPICYSTEALKQAQTAYFVALVLAQWYNSLCCKSRYISVKDQGLKNIHMIFGWVSETILCMLLCYVQPINVVFGTRDLTFAHFLFAAAPNGVAVLFWEECRKYLIRNWPSDNIKTPNWFQRNTMY